jgi:hypothetical protein
MKDWLIFTILGAMIGALGVFSLMSRGSYVEPIVIKTTKWHKTLADNPEPMYFPTLSSQPVPIPDTMQFQNIPLTPFRYEACVPFAVNDSNYEIPLAVYGEVQGWLKKLDIESPKVQFVYEIKLRKQIDWKWTVLAFAVGAIAMRAVDATLD